MFCKKGVLENFTKFTVKHLCQGLFFNKIVGSGLQLIKKETLAQVNSCVFYEFFKSTFFYRTPPMAASGLLFFYQNPNFLWVLHNKPLNKEYTQNIRCYTSTFDEFLVQTFFSVSFLLNRVKLIFLIKSVNIWFNMNLWKNKIL